MDEQVQAFRARPLEDRYPYLFLDGKVEKVRDGGRVVRKCVVSPRPLDGVCVGVEAGAFAAPSLAISRRGSGTPRGRRPASSHIRRT
jgi:hypothetical protein